MSMAEYHNDGLWSWADYLLLDFGKAGNGSIIEAEMCFDKLRGRQCKPLIEWNILEQGYSEESV
jgi:hypothetical protein